MKKTISVFLSKENIHNVFQDDYQNILNTINIPEITLKIIELSKNKHINYAYIYHFLNSEKQLKEEVKSLNILDILKPIKDPNSGEFKGYIFTTPDFHFKESIITDSPLDVLSSETWEDQRKAIIEYTNFAIAPMYGIRYNGGIPEIDSINPNEDTGRCFPGRCLTMYDLMEVFEALGLDYDTSEEDKKQILLDKGFTIPINPFFYFFFKLANILKDDITQHQLEKFAKPAYISF